MRITTLGTSHGDHTYCRYNSSTLFEIGGNAYLIDAGSPVNGLLVRAGKKYSAVKAIFITHMHDDHVGGLPGMIKSLVKYAEEGQHTTVFLPEACGIEPLKQWLYAQHLECPPELIDLRTVWDANNKKASPLYNDGTLSARSIPTKHLAGLVDNGQPASFAYVLEAENKKILCTGDLLHDFSDFPANAGEYFDLCICEATHYPPQDALPILANCRLGRLIFNHVHNPWHGDGEEKLLAHYTALPYPVAVAHDGDVFEI